MAWTTTDLTNIETAITNLATGARAVTITVDGMTVRYANTDLPQLKALRSQIRRELDSDEGQSMFNKVEFCEPA